MGHYLIYIVRFSVLLEEKTNVLSISIAAGEEVPYLFIFKPKKKTKLIAGIYCNTVSIWVRILLYG